MCLRDKNAGSPGSAERSPILRHLLRPWKATSRIVERRFYDNHEYTVQVPTGKRVYSPWFEPKGSFAQTFAEVRASGPMIVSSDRCYMLHGLLGWALEGGGPIAECGVYGGGTAHLLAISMHRSESNAELHLFDTFKGMPGTAVPERDHQSPGDFHETSLELVSDRLGAYSSFTRFHPGLMPETFDDVAGISDWAFVHLDVDIYPSMAECCRWFWPRMKSGGIIVMDDYGFFTYRYAARAAVDDYFAAESRRPIALPTGQAIIIKP